MRTTSETMVLKYWSGANYTSCDLSYQFDKKPNPNPNPKWYGFYKIEFVGLIEIEMFQDVSWDDPRSIVFRKIDLIR